MDIDNTSTEGNNMNQEAEIDYVVKVATLTSENNKLKERLEALEESANELIRNQNKITHLAHRLFLDMQADGLDILDYKSFYDEFVEFGMFEITKKVSFSATYVVEVEAEIMVPLSYEFGDDSELIHEKIDESSFGGDLIDGDEVEDVEIYVSVHQRSFNIVKGD
jgi:flagellar motor switch protein FliM